MSLEFMPYYTINYNHYEKIDNVITEKDICITFVKSNTYCYFTNPEKKEIIAKIISTNRGRNLYKKLLQKEALNIPVSNENMYKIKVEILKLLNDLIEQSKYSNFLENE